MCDLPPKNSFVFLLAVLGLAKGETVTSDYIDVVGAAD